MFILLFYRPKDFRWLEFPVFLSRSCNIVIREVHVRKLAFLTKPEARPFHNGTLIVRFLLETYSTKHEKNYSYKSTTDLKLEDT